MVKLLFFSSGDDTRMKMLADRIGKEKQVAVDWCLHVGSLEGYLRKPGNSVTLAVLLAASQEELQEIMALRPLLNDIHLILILPDRDKDTIAKGHVLAPRFLTDLEHNMQEVYDVLNKMLKKYLY